MSEIPIGIKIVIPLVKGIIMGLLLTFLDIEFVKALIIAVTSALLSGMFLVGATYITIRETGKNRDNMRDIKRKIAADKRSTDQQ